MNLRELFLSFNREDFYSKVNLHIHSSFSDGKEDFDKLVEQAKKLNIENKVIFTGKVPWNEVPKYYNLGDVFVNASITETQGLTFIEAMAAEIPVVAKYAPNLSEFIRNNQNGILVKKNSDFKKAIVDVIENKK